MAFEVSLVDPCFSLLSENQESFDFGIMNSSSLILSLAAAAASKMDPASIEKGFCLKEMGFNWPVGDLTD